jgi:fructose/tagatose bisphosphate aldolase
MSELPRSPFTTAADLKAALVGVVAITPAGVTVLDADRLRADLIDRLVATSHFGEGALQTAARWLIRVIAPAAGAWPASIHDLYIASARGAYSGRTAPAINLRGLTCETAQAIFRAARANDNKIVLFEIARSEMSYTQQRPAEYASAVLGGAIKAGWQGPVFIQGDHFQANAKNYAKDADREIDTVRALTAEAIDAGFYNIDIDASTLVDLDVEDVVAQQEKNYRHTAELTAFIRQREPEGITVSVGGEIGEVGGRNSTPADLDAFMAGYIPAMQQLSAALGRDLPGISKISVQTGTSHGGVVLPDGTIADVSVDFATLAALSAASRDRYGIGGAVQHGASTLPEAAFNKFAEANAIEVHLATAFQNQLYDHPAFPAELRERIYAHLASAHADERKPNQTDAQFFYTTRKKGFGPFKRDLWDLPQATRDTLMATLEQSFSLIMQRLGVAGSASLVDQLVPRVDVFVPMPEDARALGLDA